MKKIILATCAALLGLGALSANAMDSATLRSHPDQYRILFANDQQVIYGDMQSLSGLETRDMPSSIQNMSLTLYVENYVTNPTDFDYAEGKTVSSISEYQSEWLGNKVKQHYQGKTTWSHTYDREGHEIAETQKSPLTLSSSAVEDIYRTLVRLSRVRK